MKNKTLEKFHEIEIEIKKITSLLNSLKDENQILKNQIKGLEKDKSSNEKNIRYGKKIISKHESLKSNYDNLLQEKKNLREMVNQMLKKMEALELF